MTNNELVSGQPHNGWLPTNDPEEKKRRSYALRVKMLHGQADNDPELHILLDPDLEEKEFRRLVEKFVLEGKLKVSKTGEAMIKYKGSLIVNDPAFLV